MSKIISLSILILFVPQSALSQTKTNPGANDQYTATVQDLKGNCLLKDGEAGKPRKLFFADKLREGQRLQCEPKAKLIIKFRASGGEKRITQTGSDWYVVGNVPAASDKSNTARVMGRSKNDPNQYRKPADETNAAPRQVIANQPTTGPGFDAADLYWKNRKKYFLIVAASKSADTSLPFTQVDAAELLKVLLRLGYQPLGQGIFQGTTATSENFVTELQKIRTLPSNALVIVYYSGHASVEASGKDLWLQLYGQKRFGESYGLSVDNLIGAARGDSYKGELSVILDTCFSGRAANSTKLKESPNTVVFTSSSYQQPSVSMNVPTGVEMSAFTYYLTQGLTVDWSRVDSDRDGIMMYSDLGAYIGNQLAERFRERTLLGPMQPQLFGGFNRNWVGYDATQARNFNTESRKTVELERSEQLQDPSVTRRMLGQIASAGADSYLRALKALDDEKFDESMTLLDAAEKEGRVSLAQIHWARADVKMEQGQLGSTREWLDRAVEASENNQNADLIAQDAGMHFAVGNWPKAEERFKQALQITLSETTSEQDNEEHLTPPMLWFFLSMINLFQGDVAESDFYLKRLKEIDPNELEAQEEGFGVAIPILEILSDAIQNKTDDAARKLQALQRTSGLKTKGQFARMFDGLIQSMATSLASGETAPAAVTELLKQWDIAIKERQFSNLVLLLNQVQIMTASSNVLDSKEAEDLLARTIKFAHTHKEAKQKTITTSQGVNVTIDARDQQDLLIESATVLNLAGHLYVAKKDSVNAEKLLKEGIALQSQTKGGASLSFSAVLQLANLYQKSRRFSEAEKELKDLIKNLREPLGEENAYAFRLQTRLGDLYEDWNRPDDAENSYREALRMALVLGKDSIFAIEARETLADFLSGSDNYAEAIPLYEAAIRSSEQSISPDLLQRNDNYGNLYFSLSKSYYGQGNYETAEKSLAKVYTIFTAGKEPDLNDILICLEWQWATALWLKKQNEADGYYKRMIDTIQSELAKPKPVDYLGASIINRAHWFKDWDADKSEQLFHIGLETQTKLRGVDTIEVGDAWILWAEQKEARRQYNAAIDHLQTAKTIYLKQPKPDPLRVSYALYKIGFGHYYRQEFEQARTFLKESKELLATVPADSRDDSFSKNEWPKYRLGRVERILKNYDTARALLNSTLEMDLKTIPIDEDSVIADLLELAAISRLSQKSVEAEEFLRRAQTYIDRQPEKFIHRRAKLSHERGMLALANNQVKQAETLLREAYDLAQKDQSIDWIQMLEYMEDYSHVLRQRRKERDARMVQDQAKRLREILRS